MISQKPERAFDSTSGAITAVAPDGYDERLNRLLAAATAVIARVGYEKASMRMVAKAAGVSLAGMYHYFDSKEKMLFLIQFRAFNSLLAGVREKLHGVDDPLEQLSVMVRAHVNYFAANMAALKVCSHELDSLSGDAYEQTRRIRRDYYELTRDMVQRVLDARGAGPAVDVHIATMCLFSMLNWLYRWYDPRRGRAPSALAGQIVSQFLHGLLGAPPEPAGAAVAQQDSGASPSG